MILLYHHRRCSARSSSRFTSAEAPNLATNPRGSFGPPPTSDPHIQYPTRDDWAGLFFAFQCNELAPRLTTILALLSTFFVQREDLKHRHCNQIAHSLPLSYLSLSVSLVQWYTSIQRHSGPNCRSQPQLFILQWQADTMKINEQVLDI